MSNKIGLAIVAALLLVAAAIWFSRPESCSHWQERYADAQHANESGQLEDFYAMLTVKRQKPEGCS